MIDGSSSIPPSSQGPPPTTSVNPSSINVEGYPDPFPGMQMTQKQKQQFWANMMMQMNNTIQNDLKRQKKALKELKKSFEGRD